jgi:hypothetical protein
MHESRPIVGRPAARGAVVWALGALVCPAAPGQDAPLYFRPFTGVPIGSEENFIRIVPEEFIDSGNDASRSLDPGGGPDSLPPDLPARFAERTTTPSTGGMTAGGAFFGQFIDHDLTLSRVRFDEVLIEPFVFRLLEEKGAFRNRRTPGLDLDSVYRINPLEFPSQPGSMGPWDLSNLRFRFDTNSLGGLDFIRSPNNGMALIGDSRNDENGVVAQIHQAFMLLHNTQVNRIIERDGIDEDQLEFLGPQWWNVFNEARNYTTAYYQGIVSNEFARQLTGRSLFEALGDRVHPVGPLESPRVPVEFAGCVFRLHTLIPHRVRTRAATELEPVDDRLRAGVPWPLLFGPEARAAGRLDAAVVAPLRHIVNLIIPGSLIPITLDLAQVNLLRGREMRLPSGEEYLALLMEELGLDPDRTEEIRGKAVLTLGRARRFLHPPADGDLLDDLGAGDTDLWAYFQLEAELNGGMLGPVGQDVLERTFLGLLLADDWSLLGAHSDEFTPEQMAFFRTATFERMLEEILPDTDLDRDGRVGMPDLLVLLADWGRRGGRSDINADGVVDEKDLLVLFDEWGWPL